MASPKVSTKLYVPSPAQPGRPCDGHAARAGSGYLVAWHRVDRQPDSRGCRVGICCGVSHEVDGVIERGTRRRCEWAPQVVRLEPIGPVIHGADQDNVRHCPAQRVAVVLPTWPVQPMITAVFPEAGTADRVAPVSQRRAAAAGAGEQLEPPVVGHSMYRLKTRDDPKNRGVVLATTRRIDCWLSTEHAGSMQSAPAMFRRAAQRVAAGAGHRRGRQPEQVDARLALTHMRNVLDGLANKPRIR